METVYNLSWLFQNFALIILDDEFYLVADHDLDNRILLENVEITVNNSDALNDWIKEYTPF